MNRSYTINDLILFAYSESENDESDKYRSFIRKNKLLRKEYNTICRI